MQRIFRVWKAKIFESNSWRSCLWFFFIHFFIYFFILGIYFRKNIACEAVWRKSPFSTSHRIFISSIWYYIFLFQFFFIFFLWYFMLRLGISSNSYADFLLQWWGMLRVPPGAIFKHSVCHVYVYFFFSLSDKYEFSAAFSIWTCCVFQLWQIV